MPDRSKSRAPIAIASAFLLSFLTGGQIYLCHSLEHGAFGPSPSWMIGGPFLGWIAIDILICVLLGVAISKRAGEAVYVVMLLLLIIAGVGTTSALGCVMSYLQAV